MSSDCESAERDQKDEGPWLGVGELVQLPAGRASTPTAIDEEPGDSAPVKK